MTVEMPKIKAYSKTEMCRLLRNPEVNLSKPETNEKMSLKDLQKNCIKFLHELGFETSEDYKRIRIFSPSQVSVIFQKLL